MTVPIQRYAVTGGIACGKSTVAAWLPLWGGLVLDTDAVGHDLLRAGGEAVGAVADAFGRGCLAPDGSIDRGKLGARVFAARDERNRLNAILHPLIRRRVDAWLAAPVAAGVRFQAVLIPLLFETGWEGLPWDAVIAVVADEAEQIRRLRGRGFTDDEARLRVQAQLPSAEKARRADVVIWNHGSLDELRRTAETLFRALLERKS